METTLMSIRRERINIDIATTIEYDVAVKINGQKLHITT